MRIILSLVALTFLASCTMSNTATNSTVSTNLPIPQTTQNSTSAPAQKSFATVLDEASSNIKNTPEFEDCMRPSVNMCLTQVGNELARKNKSVDFCREMTDPAAQEACKFGIVMAEATEKGDVKICDRLSATYKDGCRNSIIMRDAMSSKDITKCDALQNNSPDQGDDRKSQCYMTIISQDQNATIDDCEKIPSDREKSMCMALMKARKNVEIPKNQ